MTSPRKASGLKSSCAVDDPQTGVTLSHHELSQRQRDAHSPLMWKGLTYNALGRAHYDDRPSRLMALVRPSDRHPLRPSIILGRQMLEPYSRGELLDALACFDELLKRASRA